MSPSFEIDRSVMLVDHNGSTLAIELPGSQSRIVCECVIIAAFDDNHEDKPGGMGKQSLGGRVQTDSLLDVKLLSAIKFHHIDIISGILDTSF